MTQVGLLTNEQAEVITGKIYDGERKFFPILDADGNYVISVDEILENKSSEFIWVKLLPLIPYNEAAKSEP